MEIQQLRAFLSVAQTKNFTKSAELLFMSQSTVTMRIKALEQTLGKQLFERDNRQVLLTAAGKELLDYAKRIIELVDEGSRKVSIEETFENSLVVGSLHSLWDYLLFPIMKEFQAKHPRTALRFITGHSWDIVQHVLDGVVDFGVVLIPPTHSDIEVLPFKKEEIKLVANADNNFTEEIDLANLSKLPYIHMDWGPSYNHWFEESAGKETHSLMVDHASLYVQYLRSGHFLGLLPSVIADTFIQREELVSLSFRSKTKPPIIQSYIIYSKRKLDSIQRLLEHMLQA
ncbi:LysR family transcriptional regulator [Bacillus sp. DTU_2020_1000418_1_SI_GHA_SEK_038]|uniref:LysR family transcriptional regulator n=1 Tax=Bacillus sp. DTU_2020_1000418_1_SI_GHA_SEK_038 TaxID=3077585 RepID=UPI0028EF1D6D|nr:LysR family transcriptional regulator [Bacillus sp. DTU_2020_1000418_1_SI_GHA_SEK_038]WNS74126.1 LysR family transcriptional regulator [Bacillus sp. DTU_2020_1000418_1_SI_GHA_SEK_038]